MDKLYCKWVSDSLTTRDNISWEIGTPNEFPKQDNLDVYSSGLFGYFLHPLLAVIFKDECNCECYTKLYEVIPEGRVVEGVIKCGSTKLTLVKKLEIPQITLGQRIGFFILCALEVYKEPRFVSWAEKWLSGEDRSVESASAAALIAWDDMLVDDEDIDDEDIDDEDIDDEDIDDEDIDDEDIDDVCSAAKAANQTATNAAFLEASSYDFTSRGSISDTLVMCGTEAVIYVIEIAAKNNKQIDLIEIAEKAMQIK